MPLYEYFCRKCTTKFELLRPMSRSDEAATCPQGHRDGMRMLSVFAAVSKDAQGTPEPMIGGGCACGGGACGCAH
ncbi:MAG: zinc ribbon domain-containing protein [Dehalococcoidia bacterium]